MSDLDGLDELAELWGATDLEHPLPWRMEPAGRVALWKVLDSRGGLVATSVDEATAEAMLGSRGLAEAASRVVEELFRLHSALAAWRALAAAREALAHATTHNRRGEKVRAQQAVDTAEATLRKLGELPAEVAPMKPDWIDGPAGWCPVQGIFDVEREGAAFRGYFRARGEHWSVELWPRSAWTSDDLPDDPGSWYAEGPVGDGPYFAGYLHHETCQALTEWALGLWREGHPGGDLGPHPDTIEVFYDGTDRQKLRGSPTGEVVS